MWREQDKVFATENLHVYVLVVVLVHCCGGVRVADPEEGRVSVSGGVIMEKVLQGYAPKVYCIRFFLQSDASKRDIALDMAEKGDIFMSEVVIFCDVRKSAMSGCCKDNARINSYLRV